MTRQDHPWSAVSHLDRKMEERTTAERSVYLFEAYRHHPCRWPNHHHRLDHRIGYLKHQDTCQRPILGSFRRINRESRRKANDTHLSIYSFQGEMRLEEVQIIFVRTWFWVHIRAVLCSRKGEECFYDDDYLHGWSPLTPLLGYVFEKTHASDFYINLLNARVFSFVTSSIWSLKMYGNSYGNGSYAAAQNEIASDLWIQRNIPGGLNGNSRLISFLSPAVLPPF